MDETDLQNSIELEAMEPLMTNANGTTNNGQHSGICMRSRDQHTTETQENPEIDSNDEDDIQSTKYCCGIPGCFALWRVKPLKEGGNEKVLDMNLTVESLRLATWSSFLVIIILGIFVTKAFNDNEVLSKTEIQKTFGNQNICLYFDYPPIPYFAPFLYNISVLMVAFYATASMFRIWISYTEGKVTIWERRLLNCCFGFLVFAAMLFSECFAVQPISDNESKGIVIQSTTLGHETMLVHTIPFMVLEVALVLTQVAVVYFGKMVAWKRTETGSPTPKWFITISIVHVILMCIITAIKLVFQVNGLGSHLKGLWWSVEPATPPNPDVCNSGPYILTPCCNLNCKLATIVDWSWFVLGFVSPLVQSLYLTLRDRKRFKTQILNIKITDNRKAR